MTIYFAKALREQLPQVCNSLVAGLDKHGIGHKEVDSGNLWIRDYFPIKSNPMAYIKFNYKTGVDTYKKYPWLQVDEKCWEFLHPYKTGIILDGGNVEQNSTTVLMTDIVFEHNNFNNADPMMKTLLIQALEKRFGKKIIFLPVEPDDDLGHIDGIAKFIDDKRVFVNDYGRMNEYKYYVYQEKIEKILRNNGLEPVLLPFAYHKSSLLSEREFYNKYPLADDKNEGQGYYINMLALPKVVFLPSFDFHPEDEEALEVVRKYYPDKDVIQIDCLDLSQLGGLIHCVTYED